MLTGAFAGVVVEAATGDAGDVCVGAVFAGGGAVETIAVFFADSTGAGATSPFINSYICQIKTQKMTTIMATVIFCFLFNFNTLGTPNRYL